MPRGPPPSPAFGATTTPPNHVGNTANMPLHVSSGDDGTADLGHSVINISSDSDSAPPSQMASPPTAFSASTVVGSSTTPATITRPSPLLSERSPSPRHQPCRPAPTKTTSTTYLHPLPCSCRRHSVRMTAPTQQPLTLASPALPSPLGRPPLVRSQHSLVFPLPLHVNPNTA